MASSPFRPSDPFGLQRVVQPEGVFPYQATHLNAQLPLAEDEILIQLEGVSLD